MNFLNRTIFKKQLENVFTPTSAAELAYVVRKNIENELRKNLLIAGKQIIVYGHSGGGKTTMITNVLKQKNINNITVGCTNGFTVDDIIVEAFDKLDAYYTESYTSKKAYSITGGMVTDYRAIKSSIQSKMTEEYSQVERRILPVQLTPNRLIDFLGCANCTLVIDDFHKVSPHEKSKLSQVMKLFVDASNRYKNVRVIAIGAVDTARQVVHYDTELTNRVYELLVPLLSPTELYEILKKSEDLLNIHFSKDVINHIITYSNQLASICHQLCFNICYEKKITKTSFSTVNIHSSDLKKSIDSYTLEKSDTYKSLLDKALNQRKGKFNNVELIFNAMISLGKNEFDHSELLKEICKKKPDYPQGNLSSYLKRLSSSDYNEIIRHDENSNKYSFNDPFFFAYTKMILKEFHISKKINSRIIYNEIFTKNLNAYITNNDKDIKTIIDEYNKNKDKYELKIKLK